MTNSKEEKFLFRVLKERPFSKAVFPDSVSQQAALGILLADIQTRTASDIEDVLRAQPPNNPSVKKKTRVLRGRSRTPRKVDALVVCPLAKEFLRVRLAFGISPTRRCDLRQDGRDVYFHSLVNREDEQIQVAITSVGAQRGEQMAVATTRLLNFFRPRIALLCGIGAGVEPKASLGDTIVSRQVLDWSGGREEPSGVRPRDTPYPVSSKVARRIDSLEATLEERWKNDLLNSLSKARKINSGAFVKQAKLKRLRCGLLVGIMSFGQTLVADGSLQGRAKIRDDRILSYDMEGSGFALACEEYQGGFDWVAFRGVSDLGDVKKKAKIDKVWQPTAAFMAGFAARRFLELEFPL